MSGRTKQENSDIIPGMNHVHAMLQSDSDDIVLSEVCSDRSEAFANLIRFIGLIKKPREVISQ